MQDILSIFSGNTQIVWSADVALICLVFIGVSVYALSWGKRKTLLTIFALWTALFLYFLIGMNFTMVGRLFAVFAIIVIITYAIKTAYFKPRPDNKNKEKGRSLLDKADLSSFPSVHAARITALGVLFSLTYGTLAVIVMSAILVIAVCVSRILLDRHYKTDVIAGFIFGLIVGYGVFLWI